MAQKARSTSKGGGGWMMIREGSGQNAGVTIDRIRKGYSWKMVVSFQKAYKLKDKRFARIIGISDRTLTRHRKEEEPLDSVASDRFYRMAKVVELAAIVFENKDQAMRWLQRPQPGLSNMIPLDMLDTEPGSHAVERLLTQIEHGVLP